MAFPHRQATGARKQKPWHFPGAPFPKFDRRKKWDTVPLEVWTAFEAIAAGGFLVLLVAIPVTAVGEARQQVAALIEKDVDRGKAAALEQFFGKAQFREDVHAVRS
jgi:hypothetical protein